MEEFITGTDQKILVHDRVLCRGDHCCIHNPSNHHMRDWPLHWRADRKLMERICEHGVGHPDPDDMAFKEFLGLNVKTIGIHGCCGCCDKATYEKYIVTKTLKEEK